MGLPYSMSIDMWSLGCILGKLKNSAYKSNQKQKRNYIPVCLFSPVRTSTSKWRASWRSLVFRPINSCNMRRGGKSFLTRKINRDQSLTREGRNANRRQNHLVICWAVRTKTFFTFSISVSSEYFVQFTYLFCRNLSLVRQT